MVTLGSQYTLGKNTKIQGEIAMSNFDKNRYSGLDQDDNQGFAGFLNVESNKPLGKDSSGLLLSTQLQTEWTQASFSALNPYRSPEFLRDWNLTNQQGQGSVPASKRELIAKAEITLKKDNWGQITYGLSGYDRKNEYLGQKHHTRLLVQKSGWNIDAKMSYLTTKDLTYNTTFYRPDLQLSKALKKDGHWETGLTYLSEKNQRKATSVDTIIGSSFHFTEVGGFFRTNGLKSKNLRIDVLQRTEYFPVSNSFQQGLSAQEVKIEGGINSQKGYQLHGRLNFRNLTIQEETLTTQKPSSTYLGRINFQARPKQWKGLLIFNATYEIGSGQEPKQSFSFLEVAAGSGTHIWQDSLYNNDGVIQLYEMAVAPFKDQANYILVRNLSDEYIQTNNVSINHSLDFNPKALWFNQKKGFKKWLKRLASKSTLQINRKTTEATNIQPWNPYQLSVADTSLVSGTVLLRNNLFFNRGNRVFNLQVGQSTSSRRFVQTTGLETRSLEDYHFRGQWNITKAFSLQVESKFGQKQNQSGFYPEKDYLLQFQEIEPAFSYLPNQQFKVAISGKIRTDENTQKTDGEYATQKNISFNLSYRKTSTSSIDLQLSYIDVQFQGDVNSPVGFAILNGLQHGANMLWSININRQLNKSLQINVGYDGRKTGDAPIIHTGRAQVRALF